MSKSKTARARELAAQQAKPGVVTEDLAKAFQEGGICLRLRLGSPGFRAKVDVDRIKAEGTDKALLSVSKRLLECDSYREIKRCHNETKHYLRQKAMPVPSLDDAYYFVPTRYVKDSIHYVKDQKQKHDDKLVPAFLGDYEGAKKEAKKKLGPLYDEADYPSVQALRAMFYMEMELQERSAPTKLRSIDADLFIEAQNELRQSFRQAALEARAYMRIQLYEHVKAMADRLAAKDDEGRPKAFHRSAIAHIEEFLKFFDDRNVFNDADMKGIVERLRKRMRGVDVDAIKEEKYRQNLATEFKRFNDELDKLVTAAPRKIRVRGGEEV